MAGISESKDKLNSSLIKISKILNKNKFDQWFIAYGTLLGIVRNNSCIDGDDDIDIMESNGVIVSNNLDFDGVDIIVSKIPIIDVNIENININDNHDNSHRRINSFSSAYDGFLNDGFDEDFLNEIETNYSNGNNENVNLININTNNTNINIHKLVTYIKSNVQQF